MRSCQKSERKRFLLIEEEKYSSLSLEGKTCCFFFDFLTRKYSNSVATKLYCLKLLTGKLVLRVSNLRFILPVFEGGSKLWCAYESQFFNISTNASTGLVLRRRETAARIILEDDIFRAMTRQVQYSSVFFFFKYFIIGSAEALPILCVSDFCE